MFKKIIGDFIVIILANFLYRQVKSNLSNLNNFNRFKFKKKGNKIECKNSNKYEGTLAHAYRLCNHQCHCTFYVLRNAILKKILLSVFNNQIEIELRCYVIRADIHYRHHMTRCIKIEFRPKFLISLALLKINN